MTLVLFDIDGTLIYHIAHDVQVGFARFTYAVKKVYGLEPVFASGYNGWVDKQIMRSVVPESAFSKKEFDMRWPQAKEALYEHALREEAKGIHMYGAIADAVTLAVKLHARDNCMLGLLTGNIEVMAYWKLKHAGIPNVFSFGVFSDAFDDRIALAKSVFQKYQIQFQKKIAPHDVVVIGDSIHDVRCGRAIGAYTIAVSTGQLTGPAGIHSGVQYVTDLRNEHPDLFVETLMDKAVLDFFGLDGVQQKNT